MEKVKTVKINKDFWAAMKVTARRVKTWPVWMGGEGSDMARGRSIKSRKSQGQRVVRGSISR